MANGYNPALNALLNTNLIQYMGGYGKAAQSVGSSIDSMGQAKLDLEKQAADQKYRDDMYKLSLNADTRAGEAVTRSEKEKFDTKNEKYATNVATNSFLMGKESPVEMSNEYAKLSLIDPTMTAKMIPEPKKRVGSFKGIDGVMVNEWSDGSTSVATGDNKYYDPSSTHKSLQYITNKDGSKTPTLVFTNEFTGVNKMAPLPGESYQEYNLRLGGEITRQNQGNADALRDQNVRSDPKVKVAVDQEIVAQGAVDDGGLPIKISSDPKIAVEQRKYANKLPGGVYAVPQGEVYKYKKQFPELKLPPPPLVRQKR